MATFWTGAAHSFYRMFSLNHVYLYLVISHLGFEGETLVLITRVPSHCLPFLLLYSQLSLLQRSTRHELLTDGWTNGRKDRNRL